MNKSLFRSCIVTAAALLLPGCLAINAILGVAGLLATGPIQYAGTAYSVGEYTYEYAVNDKTPDEVIEEKMVWLFALDSDPSMEMVPSMKGYAKALKQSVIAPPVLDVNPTIQLAEAPTRSLVTSPSVTLQTDGAPRTAPVVVASLHPRTIQPMARAVQPAEPQQRITPPQPQHIYVERKSDPLLLKMNRMEQTLAQAERVMSEEPTHGVRYSISLDEAGQTEAGISGSWSIRHGLMQSSPEMLPVTSGSVAEAPAPGVV
ncbi:MAG: hypothetical protein OCC46_14015 [Pseudodesulfovibrio sp.]